MSSSTKNPGGAGRPDAECLWHFDAQSEAFRVEPLEGKLFTARKLCFTIVNEAIQNVLDAVRALPERSKAQVTIGLRSVRRADLAEIGFEDVVQRAAASGHDVSGIGDMVPVLEISDNGVGLSDESYMRFARGLGSSGKSGRDGGRHGVGRTGMLHSSLAHTMFALSVEHGTGRALFAGLSSLRLHAVGGKDYAPYGVFVRYAEAENGRQRMEPAENEDAFRYANLLGCARRPGEHGLSVLIPAVASEVNLHALTVQVMASQFVQILLGNLSVDLRDGDRCLRLDEDTLLTEASRIQGIDGRVPDAVKDLPQIAKVTAAIRDREAYFSLSSLNPDHAPEGMLAVMRDRYARRLPVVASFPVTVRHAERGFCEGRIAVAAMKPDHCHADHSVLVRDGITEARSSRRSDPHIAIAVAEDSPLSEMLGDAEDASHTQWHERNAIDRGWMDPEFAIREFRRACTNMLDMLHEADTDVDGSVLAGFFSMPETIGRDGPSHMPNDNACDDEPDDELDLHAEERFEGVNRVQDIRDGLIAVSPIAIDGMNGIRIRLSPAGRRHVERSGPVDSLIVGTAYASLEARVKEYAPTDYDLGDFSVQVSDAEACEAKGNTILLRGIGRDLDCIVSGPFDGRRDLSLKVIERT